MVGFQLVAKKSLPFPIPVSYHSPKGKHFDQQDKIIILASSTSLSLYTSHLLNQLLTFTWNLCLFSHFLNFHLISHYTLFLSPGVFGKHCELNSYGFDELSYMEFPSLDPNNNYIYIKFATLSNSALLMYNHDNQTGDKAEFLALEVFEGRMRFSFNLGSGTYKLMTMIPVSDGQFHTVIARRAGMVSFVQSTILICQ